MLTITSPENHKNIDEIYWKEDTLRYCDEFFVKKIGIERKEITYKEQLWYGGGNAGPCLEVLSGGLEIATLFSNHHHWKFLGSLIALRISV